MAMHTETAGKKSLKEASVWFVRLMAEDVTESQTTDFITWVSASELNKTAYEDICTTWGAMDGLDEVTLARLSAGVRKQQRWPRKLVFLLATAAATIFASIVGLQLLTGTSEALPPVEHSYTSAHGETQSINLVDGTRITLNTDTQIFTTYNAKERSVFLERGEAFFEVAPELNRPFIVRFGNGQVQVLGTRFNIYRNAGQAWVRVEEGKVEVSSNGSIDKLILGAVQGANFDAQGKLRQIDDIDLAQSIAWKNGNFIFRKTSLTELAKELNRYSSAPITIAWNQGKDEALQQVAISGVFAINRIPELLNTLELMTDVKVLTLPNGQREIQAR